MSKCKHLSTILVSSLLLSSLLAACSTNSDTKTVEKETTSTTTHSNNSNTVDETEIIDPQIVTGKAITKTNVKSVVGTTEYSKILEKNKAYTAANYKLENHIQQGEEDRYDFYNTNKVLYPDILKQKEKKYLVYVYSPSCKYCKAYYDTLLRYTDAKDSLKIYKLNLDIVENAEIMAHYNVQGTPTMLYIENGEVQKIVKGITTFDTLMAYGHEDTK